MPRHGGDGPRLERPSWHAGGELAAKPRVSARGVYKPASVAPGRSAPCSGCDPRTETGFCRRARPGCGSESCSSCASRRVGCGAPDCGRRERHGSRPARFPPSGSDGEGEKAACRGRWRRTTRTVCRKDNSSGSIASFKPMAWLACTISRRSAKWTSSNPNTSCEVRCADRAVHTWSPFPEQFCGWDKLGSGPCHAASPILAGTPWWASAGVLPSSAECGRSAL